MKYKNKEVSTVGTLGAAMLDIVENGTREDAQDFLREYEKENPEYARENLGYIAGYYSPDVGRKMLDWFDVQHPIFGRNL